MRNIDQTVDGVTYEVDTNLRGCNNCIAKGNNPSTLCADLCDEWCGGEYVFKVKDIFISTPKTLEKLKVQGVKYDNDKILYSLIPSYALEAVAQNLTDGLKKYPERDNWMKVANAQERYLDALYRHLEAHRKGEIYDSDNTNPENTHLAAVVANAMFLLEFMLNPALKGNQND
jgi:Domain of unknown function (DUF5664)